MNLSETMKLSPSASSARSEDDILSMAPIKVKLGTAEYYIKALRIREARKWREKLVEQVKEIGSEMRRDTGSDAAFLTGLGFSFVQFPSRMAQLVFDYAPDLPKEKIEEEATEEQLAKVFSKIVAVAFPFQGELRTITQILGTAANFQR